MSVAIVTGAGGLVGSAAVDRFAEDHELVIGIDNNMRGQFFGPAASVAPNIDALREKLGEAYRHQATDIRQQAAVDRLWESYGTDISVVIHAAAQPSHDWAAQDPATDFSINSVGTFNLLEATRQHADQATFVFLSTSKVYGDHPNDLPLIEHEERWDLPTDHPLFNGINEEVSVDQCSHSLFGASKLGADVMVQEYGRYFGLKTGIFRAGCVTGPRHAGVQEHGFLSHLVNTLVADEIYTIFGYKGKQVRDNIHAEDLVSAIWAFVNKPKGGEVFNIGGGRRSNCSVLEALSKVGDLLSLNPKTEYRAVHRRADHRWYISDHSKYHRSFPSWSPDYDLDEILEELAESAVRHLASRV